VKPAVWLLALGVALAASQAPAADRVAEGRQHARKGAKLLEAGKCRPAIKEFTAAYQLLGDPAVLFNRAECLRKLGERPAALVDYRQFLIAMPNAPSRKLVESRIAELDPSAPPPTPDPPPPPAAVVLSSIPDAGAAPLVEEVAPPDAAPPALATVEPLPRAPLPATPIMRLDETAGPEPVHAKSSSSTGWIWFGAVVAVVAAGATAGWLFYGRTRTDLPTSSLGNYRF
jgi:tetratricopeptide (TPR) repeat protein